MFRACVCLGVILMLQPSSWILSTECRPAGLQNISAVLESVVNEAAANNGTENNASLYPDENLVPKAVEDDTGNLTIPSQRVKRALMPYTTRKPRTRATTKKPAMTTKKQTPRTTKKPTPVTTKKPTPVTTKKPPPVTTKKPTPVTTKKPTPVTTKKPTPLTTKKPTPVTTKKPAMTTTKKPTPVTTEKPTTKNHTPHTTAASTTTTKQTPTVTLTTMPHQPTTTENVTRKPYISRHPRPRKIHKHLDASENDGSTRYRCCKETNDSEQGGVTLVCKDRS